MNAIARIGSALKYDVAEDMLARGARLADVLAFAALTAEMHDEHDCSPDSTRPTVRVQDGGQ